jgi:hypothetical protein
MKKIFLFCTIIICLQTAAVAQKSRVGLSAGVSYSNMNSKIDDKKVTGDTRAGFVFGLVTETPINSLISFHPGIYYVQKGRDEKIDINNPNTKVSYALRYAELNLNFVANTHGQKINLFAGAGPSLDLNMPSKKVTDVSGTKSTVELTFGNTGIEDFRGFDWGVNFLAGARLTKGAFLAINYNQGFHNISSNPTKTNKIRNNYIGVQLGFLVNNK